MFTDIIKQLIGEEVLSGAITYGDTTVELSYYGQYFFMLLNWTLFIVFLSFIFNIFKLLLSWGGRD